ncbi:MAG TPA: hypothetical protein VE546_16970 [Streptomyces sp.]|uniref:hypothetical protein n=1 Tax=Streptomyces sp. TaxID=1931 RepID=UPI002D6CE820|nr:hypothetical protein [Streptomyces sp.]HZG05233.1 hypothetical protein [Streptomyces sp.]
MNTPATSAAPGSSGPSGRRDPASALDFTDPLSLQSADDTDRGWGERTGAGNGGAAELARFLEEKPPHHL